jgi:organic radical activating enzyme
MQCKGFGVRYEYGIGCDSYYAVDRRYANSWLQVESVDSLLDYLYRYRTKNVVITGGEPLIYSQNRIFLEFLNFLAEKRYFVTIETNGTIAVSDSVYKNFVFAISPKLSNSGETFSEWNAVQAILDIADDAFFKFAIDKENLDSYLLEISKFSQKFPNTDIFCMPVGANRYELRKNSKAVAEFALRNGFSYSDRIHIRIWNDEKGR